MAFIAEGQMEVSFKIINSESSSPIEEAHIFVSNTSLGTISDSNGKATLNLPKGVNEDIVITHVNFNTKVFHLSLIHI